MLNPVWTKRGMHPLKQVVPTKQAATHVTIQPPVVAVNYVPLCRAIHKCPLQSFRHRQTGHSPSSEIKSEGPMSISFA